jgi:hypothetical protein
MINKNHSGNSLIQLLVMIREETNLELLLQEKMVMISLRKRRKKESEQ